MRALMRKEWMLCLHPTAVIFVFFAALVFVPNYPYEVIFFFSALSVYFCCLTARENGDLAFSCALPVKKESIPLARILTSVLLQCLLLLLTGIFGAVKEAVFPAEMILNQAGISASLALVGNGALMLGLFNLLFFPRYYKNPDKIGLPFVTGAMVLFLLVAVFVVLRWTTPLFSEILNGRNGDHLPAKLLALFLGLGGYALLTLIACRLSKKHFRQVDL